MAVFSGKGTTNDSYTLELSVWEVANSIDIANNTSKVGWQLTLYSTGYNFASQTLKWKLQIDGETLRDKTEGNGYLYPATLNKNSSLVLDSGELTVTHKSDGSKSVYCYVDFESTSGSYMPGAIYLDGTLPLTDIPRYANFTEHYVSSTGLNSVTIKWNADATCDAVQYSLNGSGWVNTSGLNYTVSGLNPNTQYSIKTRIKRQDSQLWTESGIIYATTKDIAKLTTYNNFNLGDNLTVQYTNPSNVSVVIGIYGTDGLTPYASYRTTSGGSYTFNFTDEELDKLYKAFPNSNTITVRLYLRTSGDTYYYDTKDIIITLKGNQKTGHINVNGSWKRSKKWINVNGAWKRCVRWINVNGTWKRCA